MRRKLCSVLVTVAMVATMLVGCGSKAETPVTETTEKTETVTETKSEDSYKVYLMTMDQMDQHWVNVDSGC